MKNKGWLVLAILLSTAIPARAQDRPVTQWHWIEQADVALVLPASTGAARDYDLGYGGDIAIGYRFERNISFSLSLGYYDCDQKTFGASGGEWIYVPLLGITRVNFGEGPVKPFLLLGAGVAFNNYSLTTGPSGGPYTKLTRTDTDFLLSPGAGVLFLLTKDLACYAQGRVDINFAPANPAGGPSSDGPAIFVPIKLGLSFLAL